MTRRRSIALGSLVAVSVALAAAPRPAPAQPQPPGIAAPGTVMVLSLVAVTLALLVAAGSVIRVSGRRRQKEQRARELQAKLSDALLLEPALSAFPIAPTVRAPVWPRGALCVEVAGVVPTGQHRDAALQLVRREMSGLALDVRVENRIAVDPRRFIHAA